MDTVVLIILLVVAAVLGALLFIMSQRLRDLKQNGGVEMLKADVTELKICCLLKIIKCNIALKVV